MKPYYEKDGVTIYHGDCREVLPRLGRFDVVFTDPPYSVGRHEEEFSATGNVAEALHLASTKARAMWVMGTSSWGGIQFLVSAIKELPIKRFLTWGRSYVNSPACGPFRWDTVLIAGFGMVNFDRPVASSYLITGGTRNLAVETGHPAPVPVEVVKWVIGPFDGECFDPFMGSGTTLLAAKSLGFRRAIGIEIEERYCEIAAKRLSQQVMDFQDSAADGQPRTGE